MAAPTIGVTDIQVKIGDEYFTAAEGATSADAVVHVPFGAKLGAVVIKTKASAASSLYLSSEVDTERYAAVPTVAADLTDGAATPAVVTFNLTEKISFCISAAATTTIAVGTELSSYTLEVIADLDKIETINSFTLGLGNCIVYNISKYRYPKPVSGPTGIPLPKGGMAVLNATVKGGYGFYFDPATSRLIVYGGASGAETSDTTQVFATVIMLKQ